MRLMPILTEKSLLDASSGVYTFWVNRNLTKNQIKELIGNTFGVKVSRVRTSGVRGGMKRSVSGQKRVIQPRKKAYVKLFGKDTIDLFETKK